MLIKRGAEADIFLIDWYGRKAVRKVRKPREYRNRLLDEEIRSRRTLHEAQMISSVKRAGVPAPSVYFVDPKNTEIIMQYVKGELVRNILEDAPRLSRQAGVYAARLHANNIVHGDLTTSNFILHDGRLVLIDFGLSFYSERTEDKAVDVRLIKEIMSSAHAGIFRKAFDLFIQGYRSVLGTSSAEKILRKVKEIERRGRYARVV
ncbi:MAG: KEOPS complex kinase/ATPase Bud32 [Nitrososphaerales archaeon]